MQETIVHCDRCGDVMEPTAYQAHIILHGKRLKLDVRAIGPDEGEIGMVHHDVDDLDLCSRCAKQLQTWWERHGEPE